MSKTEDKTKKVKAKGAQADPFGGNKKSRLAELTADLQRVQAEFINYKNRVEAEKATLSQFAKVQTIKDLLPVIDDLERALAHQPDELKEDKWAQGVSKVYDRLLKQLEKLGVTKIDALNQPFDANLHAAVQMDGEGDTQTVSEVLQNGYQLGDQVIRHAAVKVLST
jgi:molecular chaperone GrpE